MKPDPLSSQVYTFAKPFIPPESHILVAVSGGSDSVALLLILLGLQRLLKLRTVGVAHVNHGLRGNDSDADEDFVRLLAQQHSLAFHTITAIGKTLDDPGIEAWAREWRYTFFNEVMTSQGYQFLATGHTADDQAETMLMRLLRGTGLKGSRGIATVREDGVVRPLLQTRKSELEQWLIDRKQVWCTDHSNGDVRMKRNWVRHELIPLIEARDQGAVGVMAAYAQQAQRQWTILLPLIREWQQQFVRERADESFVVDKAGLIKTALASEGVVETLREYGIAVTGYHIQQILAAKGIGRGILLLPDGWNVVIDRKSLKIMRHA